MMIGANIWVSLDKTQREHNESGYRPIAIICRYEISDNDLMIPAIRVAYAVVTVAID